VVPVLFLSVLRCSICADQQQYPPQTKQLDVKRVWVGEEKNHRLARLVVTDRLRCVQPNRSSGGQGPQRHTLNTRKDVAAENHLGALSFGPTPTLNA
jgi:hypothetical protein